jgi:hypothetical protein
MKSILTAFSFLFVITLNAQTVYVGGGTSNSLYGPIYIFSSSSANTHSWNLSIYEQAEISSAGGVAGIFTSIAWNKTSNGAYLSPDALFQVYIKHTSLAGFSTGLDFNNEVSGASLVYENLTQTLPADTGWFEIPFSTNFTWNGTDNIMVLTRWVRIGSGTDGVDWQATNFTLAKTSHSFSSTSAMGSLYTSPNRPNIRLQQSPASGVGDFSWKSPLNIFPNPSTNLMYFNKPPNANEFIISNLAGQIIASGSLSEDILQSVSLDNFSSGIYCLQLIGVDELLNSKFVVLK